MSFEYDHMDIKALATVERAFIDHAGRSRVERYLDKKKLYALMLHRAQESRRVMEPFRHWLILARSYSPDKAARRSHMVFVCLWETKNKPLESLAREDISVPRREELRGALMQFCEWLISSSKDETDKLWGRELLSTLSRLKAISKRPVNVKKSTTKVDVKPFDDKTWKEVFRVLEGWHKRSGARYPWARPLLRIQFIAGLHIGEEGLFLVERSTLMDLIESKKKEKILTLWSKTAKSLMIPFEFIQDEVTDLLRIPAAWGTIGDLLGAGRDEFEDRVRIGRGRLKTAWNHFREWGISELPEAFGDPNFSKRMRKTAIRVLWERTHDLLLVSGISGVNPRWLCNYYPFIDEGRERIEQMKGSWQR